VSDTISINGEIHPLTAKSIVELLSQRNIDINKGGVAVALNGEVVPRANWDQTSIKPGNKVEIVHIVRGG